MGARAQLHIGNRLVPALSSRRVSRRSIKDEGAWCESQLVVLCGKRSAAIFSDGISKSLRSGERQPYFYWRSRGREVRQKTYGRRAVGRVYSRLGRAGIQVRPDRRRQMRGEPGPTEGACSENRKQKSLLLHSRRVVVQCLAFCPASSPDTGPGIRWESAPAASHFFCPRVKFTLSLQTIVLNCAFSIHYFRAGGYSVG
jgi:hypothetical protein